MTGLLTLMTSSDRPLAMQKCMLASPSVTKCSCAWPSTVSGIISARMAARLRLLCSGPNHPLGWLMTKSMGTPEPNTCLPTGWVSDMKSFAHLTTYVKKSAYTSMAVFLTSMGGSDAPGRIEDGRRWSLNLYST